MDHDFIKTQYQKLTDDEIYHYFKDNINKIILMRTKKNKNIFHLLLKDKRFSLVSKMLQSDPSDDLNRLFLEKDTHNRYPIVFVNDNRIVKYIFFQIKEILNSKKVVFPFLLRIIFNSEICHNSYGIFKDVYSEKSFFL